jgi:CO dehydrogenase/acetyl-CoA synthase beta subunit
MVSSGCGWYNFKIQIIKSSSYSPGYIVMLKCAVSHGRTYICGTCSYYDCRVETRVRRNM